MITKTRVSVLAMIAIAAASVAYMGQVGLHIAAVSEVRTASMVVPDTNGILVGSRVLLRGVEIGHVRGVEPTRDGILIDWDYAAATDIPVDSGFRVDNLSALGEAYVSVLPNTAEGPFLEDGARVDSANVSSPTSFSELSARLTNLLKQVDPDAVGRIFQVLDGGLPDDIQVISNLDHAGRVLAAELTERSDSLTTVLTTLQPLLAHSTIMGPQFAAATPLLGDFGLGFQDLLNSINDAVDLGGPLLEGVQNGASPFVREVQTLLDNTATDLNVIGVNLLPAAQSGAAALRTVDVGRLLANALAATDQPGTLTLQIPITGPGG